MWKVSKEIIEVFPHPNADSLELGKVGDYQVVIPKGVYNTGDEVVFAPKRSILSGKIKEEFKQYLTGSNKDRVGQVRLRGELSEGIIVPPKLLGKAVKELPIGTDISHLFGIEEYLPPLPAQFRGKVKRFPKNVTLSRHDVYQYHLYKGEFLPDDEVVITEKLHGSQVAIISHFEPGVGDANGIFVTSKGINAKLGHLEQDEGNVYWQALVNSGLKDLLYTTERPLGTLHIFGEVIPVQGGNWSYGQSKPTIRIFDYRVNGVRYPVPLAFSHLSVPVIFEGKYKDADVEYLCKGKEQVSGRELHIREGIVITPKNLRKAKDGRELFVKVINPAYAKKETGSELS